MRRALKIVSCAVFILSVFLVLYMMINQMGLIDVLDFGAGVYYCVDIPEFERIR